MSDYLIIVVNRAEAKVFTLVPARYPKLESSPRLMLCTEIQNDEIKDVRTMYSDSKTGRGSAPKGGGVHGYDDKRDKHQDELRRRFAATVMTRIRKLAKREHARTIICASSARMRRFLYPDLDLLIRDGYKIHKLSKNMINFSPQKIHAYLAKDKMVPRQKMAVSRGMTTGAPQAF